MKFSYRKLEINDLTGVYKIGSEVIDNNAGILKWEIENISNIFSQDLSSSFVAHIKKKIVGFIISKIEEESKICTIYWIGVVEKYRKTDIERNLIKTLVKDMRKKQIEQINIYVQKENVDLLEKISYIGFKEKKQLLGFEMEI